MTGAIGRTIGSVVGSNASRGTAVRVVLLRTALPGNANADKGRYGESHLCATDAVTPARRCRFCLASCVCRAWSFRGPFEAHMERDMEAGLRPWPTSNPFAKYHHVLNPKKHTRRYVGRKRSRTLDPSCRQSPMIHSLSTDWIHLSAQLTTCRKQLRVQIKGGSCPPYDVTAEDVQKRIGS